jgi:predicted amidohydrolase YtcJ
MYPFGDLARSGATLAMGSDRAVTTANPLEQIEVAVTHIDPQTRDAEPFLPHQALSLPTAHTLVAGRAVFSQ